MKRLFLFSLFALCFVPLSGQHYIGFSGGGWPGHVQIRGAVPVELQARQTVKWLAEVGFIRRNNPDLIRKLPPDLDFYDAVISYGEVALMGKLDLSLEVLNFYAFGGPSLSYGFQAEGTYRDRFTYFKQDFDFRAIHFSRWDFGLNVGIGFEKYIGEQRKIFLNLRYYLGLLNLERAEGKIYNQGTLLNLGMMFPL